MMGLGVSAAVGRPWWDHLCFPLFEAVLCPGSPEDMRTLRGSASSNGLSLPLRWELS